VEEKDLIHGIVSEDIVAERKDLSIISEKKHFSF
jgi:hypothetical protein